MKKSSSNSHSHPYTRGWYFWGQPENQFWEKDGYTEKGKDYYRNWIAEMRDKKARYTTLE